MMEKTHLARKILPLVFLCVILAVIPLFLNKESVFAGADSVAEEAIMELDPQYQTWAEPIVKLPGGETESLLFCIQAALGAGIFGYGIGVLRTKHKYESQKTETRETKTEKFETEELKIEELKIKELKNEVIKAEGGI